MYPIGNGTVSAIKRIATKNGKKLIGFHSRWLSFSNCASRLIQSVVLTHTKYAKEISNSLTQLR